MYPHRPGARERDVDSRENVLAPFHYNHRHKPLTEGSMLLSKANFGRQCIARGGDAQ